MKLNAITLNLPSVDDSGGGAGGRGARLLRTTWSRRSETNPRSQPELHTDVADKLSGMIKKAKAWKLSLQFEDESFDPVINHNANKD